MKKLLSLFLAVLVLFSCTPVYASADLFKSNDDPVDIYLLIVDFEGAGAEAYIESLREDDTDGEYKYYNENYYIQTITERERKEYIKE